MIEILSSAALATVQDAGRLGSLRFGVGTAGAMDQLALAVGNLLLGNPAGAAALEIPVYPFQVRFTEDCVFALTGADGQARSTNASRPPVVGGPGPQGPGVAHRAAPAWLRQPRLPGAGRRHRRARGAGLAQHAVARGLRRTGWPGRTAGRCVARGNARCVSSGGLRRVAASPGAAAATGRPARRAGVAGGRIRLLPRSSRAAFWAGEWKITAQSDRYGYRLQGTPLVPVAAMEIRSHGIVPGVIQVPSSGQPIVQMRDAQPSGGYPKFGTVIEADLWRLGQAAIGSRVRFIETDFEAAVAALGEVDAWLEEVRRLVELQRWALQRK
jgi:allophanate hydrolase subunit 2